MHRTLYLQAFAWVYGLKLLAERKLAYSPFGTFALAGGAAGHFLGKDEELAHAF